MAQPIEVPSDKRFRSTAVRVSSAVILALTAVMAMACGAPDDNDITSAEQEAKAKVPCPVYLKPDQKVVQRWTYQADKIGRPHSATAFGLKNLKTRPRTNCETEVGSWLGRGYDGSHLIAATMDGVSRRYNLVPMTKQANVGPMKSFENLAKKCANNKSRGVFSYQVLVKYNNIVSIRPSHVSMSMVVLKPKCCKGKPQGVSITIPNSTDKGTMTRIKSKLAVQALALGC